MTTTSTHETEITADPEVPLIRIVREFDAPPDKVFRAHADPDLFAQWIGPDTNGTKMEHWDCRSLGSWRWVSVHDGVEQGFHGCFHDVRPGELIVQTFTWEGDPDGVALEKLVFEDLGNGRTRLVATSLCDSFVSRDQWMASGMEDGVVQGYAKLDALLAG